MGLTEPEEWTPELAWAEIEKWLPQALEHVRESLARLCWALEENHGPWDQQIQLRRRVLDGAAEHECEMFQPGAGSLSRFSRELREELLDAIVYAAMYERQAEMVNASYQSWRANA
jgi:hypothetical protein